MRRAVVITFSVGAATASGCAGAKDDPTDAGTPTVISNPPWIGFGGMGSPSGAPAWPGTGGIGGGAGVPMPAGSWAPAGSWGPAGSGGPAGSWSSPGTGGAGSAGFGAGGAPALASGRDCPTTTPNDREACTQARICNYPIPSLCPPVNGLRNAICDNGYWSVRDIHPSCNPQTPDEDAGT